MDRLRQCAFRAPRVQASDGPDRRRPARQAEFLDAALRRIEAGLETRDGPYWFGERPTLVDLSLYPHLERFCAVEHYRGYRIPEDCWRLKDWLAAMRGRDSAQSIARPDEVYIRNWGKYARGGGRGATARDMQEM